ncbi:MAG: hypothetical protein WBE50_13840, partial [Methyloceanibacter sp.]
FHTGKAAFRAVDRAEDRRDMRVDQPGWHQLSIEGHHLGGSADQRRDVGIVPDGGNGVSNAIACRIDRAGSAV